ncbi:hypothetical protein TIFTF001_038645 [Ficus carica]|uniref:Uncharacterized protein n=1 Tax=Ficus carica TaxID=3494 RepID=A0AA88JF19_FICCA|nr:hypothetical protein TIFTF001_041241 [Ficus carica]GMN28914.1 hypothetical protein TIFTF001_041244 [Ficus carica]GMN69591.1 hypothetical protein TIFTF001_038640 [Ficus carica]GMN69602.1 hypothetical protein TIFTF001_038645 [Ficus carica]
MSDYSSDDDEWSSAIHRLRFEFESHQSRTGAKTSDKVIERNHPATTSGTGIPSIPPIARLNKPPRRLSVESFLRTSNPHSVLTDEDLSDIRGRYGFPNEVQLRLPLPNERADTVLEGWICMYTIYFECGLRLPIPPLLIQTEEAGVELSVDDILAIYYPQENSKDHSRYTMYPRRKKQVVGEMKNADRYWQDRKELKKPPPKALLFEEKLEHLLA